jgi:hypothetical protein
MSSQRCSKKALRKEVFGELQETKRNEMNQMFAGNALEFRRRRWHWHPKR